MMPTNSRIAEFYSNQIALLAYRYASHYGGHTPMLMVAQVFVNRNKRGWGNWPSIIQNQSNFAATLQPPTSGYPDPWDRNFLRVLSEMDGIMNDSTRDITNGALYFADLGDVNEWFIENIARSPNHQRVADTCGTLVFWN